MILSITYTELKMVTLINKILTEKKSSNDSIIEILITELCKQNWEHYYDNGKLFFVSPKNKNKDSIKAHMGVNRKILLNKSDTFIQENFNSLKKNLASSIDAYQSSIEPTIEVCSTREQINLFRMCRYYWSSPYSDYVGRRIKLIIRDAGLPSNPIIGIAALGSPLLQIASRDKFIGWTNNQKKLKLNNTMDIYILGAMPPYNDLLGGKLIAYILASNEVRKIFSNKYSSLNKKEELACLFTTSLYGRSSLYNRINYDGQRLYNPAGFTRGLGTSHISSEVFDSMVIFLKENELLPSTNLSSGGPNWKIRVIRQFCRTLNIDEDSLLTHNTPKEVFVIPLANNYSEYLCGESNIPDYYNYSLTDMVEYWKKRWLFSRKKTILTDKEKFKTFWEFNPENFTL